MQETPPHTLLEIKLLLSQYLDGLLEPEQVQEVEGLLSRFPQYVEELGKLQKTRDALKASLDNHKRDVPDEQGAWQTIAKRLKADGEADVRVFDAEFVSAYYDGEIPASDSEFIEFESQLFHNATANEMLAHVGEVSELVRQFGYRLETACTVDMTQSVMAAFRAESGMLSPAAENEIFEAVPAEIELLSAYLDQALTPRETIEANRLIESDSNAKATLTHFNHLSGWIHSVSSQIQAQAPDLWPTVSEILSRSPEQGGLVVSLDRFRTLKRWAKIAGPVAASVLLAAFLMSSRPNSLEQGPSVAQSIPVVTPVTTPQTDITPVTFQTSTNQTELASVPAKTVESRGLGLAFASERAEVEVPSVVVEPVVSSRHMTRPSAQVIETPLPARLASRPVLQASEARPENHQSSSSPSSEEYLFNALNEQMPGEDISSIFRK